MADGAEDKVTGEDRRGGSPQSVTRVIRLLEALCASNDPVSLADLSRRLSTPKSSLAALLRGLADEDLVVSADGAWRLGPGAFGLGSALTEARRRLHSSDLIREGMRRLCERTGETVLLAVGDHEGDMVTYVDLVESRNVVRYSVSIGDRRPFYATAGGRALLATCSPEAIASYLKRVAPRRLASTTEIDLATLTQSIEQARADGYAQTVDQAADGVTGTASVIRDAAGGVVGALVVAAPTERAQGRLDELARLTLEEAASISRSLGFR
ncbi:IclR family transcriptional regulator [Novosphingobium mangrovi (ex Huang et al. 2023)]|uniref:IclR family transcriptional regulator n=1 Tax=Novosphingobium mangrovi (ex Huang et al. 2023) TaxID=2976432 RepID=A0ABT2I634_9SPHN|nr:IclR family transcriptional regulator [Novosphingobium mangrovi (ex Huang et al. 2023)]MCT2400271.1 IclR family transcriptional regulator [Novosphingobium mangrovi (ex Huang et al. 2023)]